MMSDLSISQLVALQNKKPIERRNTMNIGHKWFRPSASVAAAGERESQNTGTHQCHFVPEPEAVQVLAIKVLTDSRA